MRQGTSLWNRPVWRKSYKPKEDASRERCDNLARLLHWALRFPERKRPKFLAQFNGDFAERLLASKYRGSKDWDADTAVGALRAHIDAVDRLIRKITECAHKSVNTTIIGAFGGSFAGHVKLYSAKLHDSIRTRTPTPVPSSHPTS